MRGAFAGSFLDLVRDRLDALLAVPFSSVLAREEGNSRR
jgi:hypothetical protein